MPETIVVTRHGTLHSYLMEKGLVDADVQVISNATIEDVKGKKVIGVLPYHLAAAASSIIEVKINTPPPLRGANLTLEQVRKYASDAQEYKVVRIGDAK